MVRSGFARLCSGNHPCRPPVQFCRFWEGGDHEGIRIVVLWQVGIGFVDLLDLLGNENMDLPLEATKTTVLAERVYKTVPVDGGGLQPDYHINELHGTDTILSDNRLAPPRLFCTEKLLCVLPSGFMRGAT